MKTIKATSKLGRHYRNMYNSSQAYCLNQVYKSYSEAKATAEDRCLRLCASEGGTDFRIIGAGSFTFTAAWTLPDRSLRVETACNSYIVKF